MYAIFEDGSRQYRVAVGDLVKVDYREIPVGSEISFDRVLLVNTGEEAKIGEPVVAGAKVVGEVFDHPSIKTYIQKFRRRKTYRRFTGHRQPYTRVRITDYTMPGWERPKEQPEETSNSPGAEAPEGNEE